MTDPVVPAVAPKPVAPVVPAPAPVVAAAPPVKIENPKTEEKPEDEPKIEINPNVSESKGKTAAARLDALEARLAYLTALMGWPTEEHDEKLAEKAKAEQVDFAGNPVKAA